MVSKSISIFKEASEYFLQHEAIDAEKQMAETDIEKALLKCHKNDHVTFNLKTLTANPAATQKTIRANQSYVCE